MDLFFLSCYQPDSPPSWMWLKNKHIPRLLSGGTPTSPFLLGPGTWRVLIFTQGREPPPPQVPGQPEQEQWWTIKTPGLPGVSPLPGKLRER